MAKSKPKSEKIGTYLALEGTSEKVMQLSD